MTLFGKNGRNLIIMWFRDALFLAAAALTSNSVLLPLYIRLGMSDGVISFLSAFTQAELLVLSLLLSGITSKYRRTKYIATSLYLLQSALNAGFIVFCIFRGITAAPAVIAVYVISALTTAVLSVRTIFDYKLICEVIDVSEYSFYISIGGIVNGALSIAVGVLLPFAYSFFDFYAVIGAVILTASLFMVISGVLNSLLKLLPGKEEEPAETVKRRENLLSASFGGISQAFSDKDFRAMIIPNFTRGLGAGMLSVIPLLAVRYGGLTEENTSLIVGISNAAIFVSCAVYAFVRQRRKKASVVNFISALAYLFIIPAMLGNATMFMVFYFLAYAGYYIVSNAIPDIVYNTVDESIISAFNTWRMAFTTLGIVISTAVIGAVMSFVSGVVIASVSSGLMVFSCAAYLKHYGKRV